MKDSGKVRRVKHPQGKARRGKKLKDKRQNAYSKKQVEKRSAKLEKRLSHLSEADKTRVHLEIFDGQLKRSQRGIAWDAVSKCRKVELKQFRRWMDNEKRKPKMCGLTLQGADDLLEWSFCGNPGNPPWILVSKRRAMEDSAQVVLNRFCREKREHARAQGVVVDKGNGEDDDAVRDWWNWVDGRGKCVKRTFVGDDGQQHTVRGRERRIPKAVYHRIDDHDDDDEEMDNVVPLSAGEYRLSAEGCKNMASSTGSGLFTIVSLLLVGLCVLLLLRHFLPLRSTPAYILVPIFLSLFLPVGIVLLLPIDLASSLRAEDEATRGVWLPDAVVLVAWRITYWLTFALTWFILPLLGEYIDSGYRAPKDRFIYSLRSNGRYQLIVLGCGIGGLVYVFLQNGFQGTSVKALIMALAYCWGLIFAIYLMGHGLVAVPRRLYRNASVSNRLRRIQSQAPSLDQKLADSINDLEILESQVTQLRQRKNGISRDHQEWIEEISDGSQLPEARLSSARLQVPTAAIPAVITDRYLAELARKLNRARHKRIRFIDTWDRLVQDAAHTQAILDASASKRLDFGTSAPHASFLERLSILTPQTRYLLHYYLIPYLRIFLAGILSLASLCIIWSEFVKHIAPQLSVIRFTVVSHRKSSDGKVHFAGQIMASLWMFYMITAALASFSDIRVWGNRALVKRNTYGESATWYAGQVAKLTVPLAYNFLTFLPPGVHRETTFYGFLGQLINLTPLGKGFDFFFPIFILVPVCATLFNLYGRAKSVFRFDIIDDDDEGGGAFGGGWREGRDLIQRDLDGNARLGLSSQRNDGPPPARYQDSVPSSNTTNPSSSVPGSTDRTSAPPSRLAAATAAAEEQDENFFQGFAHR
ncbi:MAG: hypothetical protein Q9174_005882, partial [Haloplaca sp. 1 TL-2023]